MMIFAWEMGQRSKPFTTRNAPPSAGRRVTRVNHIVRGARHSLRVSGAASVCSPACAQLAGPFVDQCGAWLRDPAVAATFQLSAIVDFIDGCGSKGGGH